MTHRALDVDEAAREIPALEVLPKLLPDVFWKRAVVRLARVTKEVLQVLLHETEEHGFLRPTRDVGPGQPRHAISKPRAHHASLNPATLRAASPGPDTSALSTRHPPRLSATRVRVAVSTLRRLGLAGILLTREDGYLLDPRASVRADDEL